MIRKKRYILCLSALLVILAGCENNVYEVENYPPAVPRGLVSVTGDEIVYLYWYPNNEADLAGYVVYSSLNENGPYVEIGTTRSAYFDDYDVNNGETYYYAVSAFDNSGLESDLSVDLVFDTPRPEGYGVRLFDYHYYIYDSGYDFSDYEVQRYDFNSTDIVYDVDTVSGVPYLVIGNINTDIQDFGYTESLDDIDYAPTDGWSQLGWVEVISGHTYIIWTHDNHFAKLRVVDWNSEYLSFDWAYQVDEGNRELLKGVSSKTSRVLKMQRFTTKGGDQK